MNTLVAVIVLACFAGTLPAPGVAQTPPRQAAAVIPDTALASPFVRHIFSTVSTYIARAAQDTLRRPWRIVLPDSGPPWPEIREHLFVSLRARPASPADSQFYHLTVGPIRVEGDTARSRFEWGLTRLCPVATGDSRSLRGGYANVEEVYAPVSTHFGYRIWGRARSDHVIHGDLFGCMVDPDF
jgi:hypothetical protein